MKKASLFVAIATVVTLATVLAVCITHANHPTGIAQQATVFRSYTPQYASAIQQIAASRGVKPWQVSITCHNQYCVSVADSGYVGAGKKSIPVWYLCVNGLEEPIYADDEYICRKDIFDLALEDINPELNAVIDGYTGAELVSLHNRWFKSLKDINVMFAAAKMSE